MIAIAGSRRTRFVFAVLLAFVMTCGTLLTGSGRADARTAAAKPAKLKAVLTVSPKTTRAGQRVTASVKKSVLPKGDKVKSIRLNWGDHTKTVVLASLKAKPKHRYSRPGRYTVLLVLTDKHKKVARAKWVEKVLPAKTSPTPPPSGSYTGTDAQNLIGGVTFYVSADRASLQEVRVPLMKVACVPDGASVFDQLQVPSVALHPDGSFTSTTTQTGVFSGHPATFTYLFSGHLNGTTSSGAQQLSGTLRENIHYTDIPARDCTSDDQPWTAARDSQPAQPTTAPPSGSYTGTDAQNLIGGVTFYVSADSASLQDLTVPLMKVACVPDGASVFDQLQVASVALHPDGSFTSTTTQTGVFSGHPATFTYLFSGNVHGLSLTGSARLAGTLREDVDYTDSPSRHCTSDDQPWTATRDNQPAQPTTAPPSGSYTGTDAQNLIGGVTFHVAADSASLQDLKVPLMKVGCLPDGANVFSQLQVASVALHPDGSFTSTTTQTGVFSGHPATFTYLFSGNVHGLSLTGSARLAGTLRENVDYTDSPSRHCTSDDQPWTATRTGP
ncbi:MAG: hypothetical protein QOJ11_3565 [Frankiales bacterium]|jgi:hypothetical protein|nr:hypothetical protein [Frankiales bacterium]